MMSALVAALRGKNRRTIRDPVFNLRSQYPQYVLYDSDGDEVECNLSNMKMSYGSGSKTVLTDVIVSPRRGFWSNRTAMEKHLIMIISALFVVTIGLVLTAGIMSYKRQITFVLLSKESTYSTTPSMVNQSTVSSTESKASITPSTVNPSTGSSMESKISITPVVSTERSVDSSSEQNTSRVFSAVRRSDDQGYGLVDDTYDVKVYVGPNDVQYSAPDVCNTTACVNAGKLIKSSLNASVDPCDDFYAFACGGWEASHSIPKDKSSYLSFDELDDNLKKDIKDMLSKTRSKSDSNAVIYASDLYKACIDEVTIESRGVSPLVTALKSIGGWPLADKAGVFDSKTYDWEESFSSQVVEFGLAAIYSMSVQPDANDTKVHRIWFDSATFGLGRNQLVNTSAYPDIVKAYKNFILESALLLGANNDSKTHKDIEDMLTFESQLANLSLSQEMKRDSKVWYNRMSFKELNQLTDNSVDWLNITNKIFSKIKSTIDVKSDELVIVNDIQYYKEVTKLMTKTPNRVIANYLGWMTVMGLGSYTTKSFRKVEFEFNHVVSGVEKESELWKSCVERLGNSIEYAVSRLYIDENFTEKDKQEASVMIQDIKESYTQLIQENQWLDSITKNKSLIKLQAIHENIGFPEWLTSNEDLDKYYNLTQRVDPKKSFEGILYLQFNSVFREFKSIREAVNLSLSWPMPPAIVNAAYEPTQNSITIPAGILKVPFFDSKRPVYLNYGAIGLVVGHEMTHGFDDEGSQFGPNGNLINWWTEEVHKRFEQKADCFIKEYSDIYDAEAEMHLNGNNTVGENIADNGGLRETYRAYQLYVKRHGVPQRLPYVTEYSPEQLFFLGHANVWCNLMRPEALKTQIQYNPHSPGKYRVNVPVSNFEYFSKAYKCSETSRMNRKDKCVLW